MESPLIIHQNGIIKYYIVQIVNIYNRKDTENVTLETEDTFIDIKRDEEAVKLEISVRAVNQIGEGPEAILHITLNPYKDLPEIQDAVIILEVSLQALNNKEPNETSITPTQTSILVESLSRSLESVKQANESVNIDQSYFQDAIKAGSLLWETGILPNEGQSVSPSKNYADFLRIIDVLSILYTEFTYNSNVKRDTAPMESTFLESDNLHLTVMRLESGEIELGPLMLSVNSPRMLSHVQIDNPLLTPEDTGSSNDVIFSDKIHNFNLNTGNEDISATIMFNKSSGMNQECVFFNTTLNKWDTSGILTHVTPTGVNCETNHFTSFGVLVRPFDAGLTREQNLALSVVTYLLLSISLILLTIAIILYVITYKLTLRVEGNIVHFNYAIALFLATGTFIFGIQTATNSHPGCFVVTVLMHYTWLAVFAWSMCIAIMLFYKIFFVFSERRISWYLMFLGWGSPIVVVAITAGTANAYYIRIGEDHCWLSQERGLIWSFIGPILIILLVNMILLVMSTVKIFMSMSSFDKDRLRGLRVSLLSAAIMLPVLNTPWLLLLLFTFGVSAYSIIIEWMFVFLNASNGILFFFLLVLRNNEIRKSLRSGRFTKWMFTLRRGDKTDVSSQGRLSSKYSLKKQRTTDSYVESGMRKSLGDSMEIGDTRSPRSSVGDFPQPIPKQARTKEGFVALPTQDEITNEEPSYSNLSDKQTTGTEGTQPEPIYSQVNKKSKDPEYVNIPDLTTDQEPEPELKENTPVQDDSFVD
ncbi:Adhesion G-protein coupled receptor D1-like [Oopsacas minuta]|uniref:Adhesion G-protein coupled receptor D1-like n=1 Tax=Oopsacas minuta TaxID=111878 RepID=A0AAV7KIV0_9METZ|nr:Adhesion G-protein coupled receptor D1-like [Oopsacas minuta]